MPYPLADNRRQQGHRPPDRHRRSIRPDGGNDPERSHVFDSATTTIRSSMHSDMSTRLGSIGKL
jgi:hypothetical protein